MKASWAGVTRERLERWEKVGSALRLGLVRVGVMVVEDSESSAVFISASSVDVVSETLGSEGLSSCNISH